jgi:hypothetical protein
MTLRPSKLLRFSIVLISSQWTDAYLESYAIFVHQCLKSMNNNEAMSVHRLHFWSPKLHTGFPWKVLYGVYTTQLSCEYTFKANSYRGFARGLYCAGTKFKSPPSHWLLSEFFYALHWPVQVKTEIEGHDAFLLNCDQLTINFQVSSSFQSRLLQLK